MKEPKAFREKEEVEPGAILSSVERDKVWITRGNEREKLEILPVGSHGRPTATAAPTVAPPVAAQRPFRPSRRCVYASRGRGPPRDRYPAGARRWPPPDTFRG